MFKEMELKSERTDVRLFVLNRETFCPRLEVRLGVVEDNDDLTPLLELKNLTTLEIQGEFFLADLLHNQDEDNRVLIATVCTNLVH